MIVDGPLPSANNLAVMQLRQRIDLLLESSCNFILAREVCGGEDEDYYISLNTSSIKKETQGYCERLPFNFSPSRIGLGTVFYPIRLHNHMSINLSFLVSTNILRESLFLFQPRRH